jgi:SAM-dependent methyltransferase
VLCTSDPASGNWELSSMPLFGDRTNSSIFDMVVCGDYLYSGAFNLRHGFQIYRTTAEGTPPHHWEKVLDLGADRGALNQSAISMTEFRGALYVGTCIQNSGFDPVYQVGPAAGEVLRIYPDKTWDLLVGEPRMTRQGLKIPSSGMRAGFDNPLAGYIWRMTVHDDTLYVGTCDNSAFVPFSKGDRWPQHARFLLDSPFMERYMSLVGGCELWRTTDGNAWTPITRNGFGNPYNLGIRTLISTRVGLFVGTANPFGPDVAVRGLTGWEFQNNPRGGTEIWHGSMDHAAAAPTAVTESYTSKEGFYRIGQRSSAATNATDPFLRLASTPTDLIGLSESVEDELHEYFGGKCRNVGFWRNKSTNPIEACRALIFELCNLLRNKSSDPVRSILGVSPSPSELAAELSTQFPDAVVRTGTTDELLRFKDEEFDATVWVEGASSARRQTAVQLIAGRIRPGGCAVFADGIRGAVATTNSVATPSPNRRRGHAGPRGPATIADSPERFVADLANAGLADPIPLDVTTETWLPFFNHSRNYFLAKLLLNQIDSAKQASIFASLPAGELGLKQYILVSAVKPKATNDH